MDRLLAMRVFECVAEENSFAGAARALGLSPPVVTRLVAELENHLGTRLFQRTTRRVSLTEAGQTYLARVRQILQDIDEAESLASAHTSELSGRLRIHTQPVLASHVIAPLLSEFHHLYPGILIDIDVETHRAPPVEDYDLTLLGTDAQFNADLITRRVIESNVILVASPGYLQRKGTPETPHHLVNHDNLRLSRPDSPLRAWRLWHEQAPDQSLEIDVEPVLIANHTDTLLRAALDGAGITSVSVDIAATHLQQGELVRVLSPWITGRLAMHAALPSRKFIPQRTRVFLDFLIERTRAQVRALSSG